MLNETNWKYYPFDCAYNYAILFAGRIVIGYGVSQTLHAFRKYSKL